MEYRIEVFMPEKLFKLYNMDNFQKYKEEYKQKFGEWIFFLDMEEELKLITHFEIIII